MYDGHLQANISVVLAVQSVKSLLAALQEEYQYFPTKANAKPANTESK